LEQPSDPGVKEMIRSTIAVLISVGIGGVIALAVVVILMELLHTKDALVGLTVFALGAGLGCYTAIRVRRQILQFRA
jgi:VIT1/CCC1 family predicted Fe2+/Mn2+ transporter